MEEGIIIKGVGGFYYVQIRDSNIIECKARGKFRKENIIPMVGDHVLIEIYDSKKGVIEEILPRKNQLIRPPVSNIDQAIIVFALQNPNPNLQLLDRFLVQGERENLSIVICINKIDTLGNEKRKEKLRKTYTNAGYPIIFTSVKDNKDIDRLKEYLDENITVFAGPSGVGKSSLLNTFNREYHLKTGDVSKKIGRGRHTTRHVELFSYGENGFVVDTPGFSNLSMANITEEELMNCFPEFRPYLGQCKFKSCLHRNEPKCAILEALKKGEISSSRYNNYLYFVEEIKSIKTY